MADNASFFDNLWLVSAALTDAAGVTSGKGARVAAEQSLTEQGITDPGAVSALAAVYQKNEDDRGGAGAMLSEAERRSEADVKRAAGSVVDAASRASWVVPLALVAAIVAGAAYLAGMALPFLPKRKKAS